MPDGGALHFPEQFRRWFDYEKDAHARVVTSLHTVPDTNLSHPDYQKALDLLAHIVAARATWLHRIGYADKAPTTFFPTAPELDILIKELDRVQRQWSKYLHTINEDELLRVFEYNSSEGPHYRNRVFDILTQLFGHSWYHRGQIAALVRSLGGTPAETDFVYWSRKPIER